MTWFSYLLTLFGLSWACVGLFRWYAIEKGMLDQPSARSSHIAPTPRGGGVIFFMGWMILLGVLRYYNKVSQEYVLYFSPVILVGLIGFWDDHNDLSASTRFVVHCIAAATSLFILKEGGGLVQPWLGIPLPLCFIALTIAVVWVINLFNFMDGSDGIATSEGIFVFGVGGYILFQYHAYELATLAWSLAALLGGFLTWNWPIARIFMGDSGSYFLGFMVALYALISYKLFKVPLMIWVILTAFFWFDATITLLRRVLAGEEWRKPHRKHAYQRLIQAGWSHQQVLLGSIGLNSILSILAFMVYKDPRGTVFAFGLTLCILFFLYILVEITKPMYKKWHDVAQSESS